MARLNRRTLLKSASGIPPLLSAWNPLRVSAAPPRPSPAASPERRRPAEMEFIYFTKHWPQHDIGQLIDLARRVGADGLDLTCRKGHPVNPENAKTALPEAMKRAREAGLSIPLVTTDTSLNDPKDPKTEPILAACGEAGVRFLKLGYYGWKPGDDYWAKVDAIRRNFEAYEKLAAKHDVTICYHTHSGGYMGSNAAGLMHLLKGFDPSRIGAYVDRGHIAANGELWPMALAMVGDHLKIIGGKTIGWYREPTGGGANWTRRFVPFREGLVDWTATFRDLLARGFDGPVTLHGEYDLPMTPEQHIALLADDFTQAREALTAAKRNG
ncbi:MAG: sugar phosphate isomerase/epimerase [Armatimonadetes bacterium]|nr:sugar phosphate isomerase/epimerase [Armatimonadota bacterium]